jgi:hypothetical protein
VSGGPIPEEMRDRVRLLARNRCGYCRSLQHLVLGPLEIDHIQPTSQGGLDDETNLWLACRMCNNFKSDQTEALDPQTNQRVPLFNPRLQEWADHFSWDADGVHILGRTACGRATILALQLNHAIAVTVRSYWVAAGWHPPS